MLSIYQCMLSAILYTFNQTIWIVTSIKLYGLSLQPNYGFDNHFRIFSPQMLYQLTTKYAPHVLQVRKFMKDLAMHGCFPSEKFDFWSPRYSWTYIVSNKQSIIYMYICISSVTTCRFCSSIVPAGYMRGGFNRYIVWRTMKRPVGLWRTARFSHRRFILIFGGYFQLLLVYVEKLCKNLYKVYVIWTFCCTGNTCTKFMKVHQCFFFLPQILPFERSLSLSGVGGGARQSCFTFQYFSWRPGVPI